MPSFLGWIIGGVIGGAIGAAIWAGVAYGTGYEIGWLAWGVGVLVGIGVRAGAGESYGVAPGMAAAVIALIALLGGRYASISITVSKALGDVEIEAFEAPVGEERVAIAISDVADMVIEQWDGEGKTIGEVDYESLPEDATIEDDYPADVWAEAVSRWEGFSEDVKGMMLADIDKRYEELAGMGGGADFAAALTKQAFRESFGPMDLLFAGLALFSAFKLGSGMNEA